MSQALLSIENLSVRFKPTRAPSRRQRMTFDVRPGEILAWWVNRVRQIGYGLAVVRTLPGSGRISGGRILFHGEDLAAKSEAEMQAIRGRRIAMVFQAPTPRSTRGVHHRAAN
jgi:peptide/nickel transport system ATP-binding protein/oligopeptide transport system ATP-binding protein